MKPRKLLIATLFIFVSFLVLAAEIWKTKTDESYVNFTTRGSFGKVHGKITGLNGEIKFNEQDLENSSFKAWVEAGTLDTDNKKRDKHLKSSDFLDVPKFPSIRFNSKKISKTEAGFEVTGDLTLKETTKEITFPFTFDNQGSRGVFRGSLSINRRDFNVGGKTKLAGDNIHIEVVTVVEK